VIVDLAHTGSPVFPALVRRGFSKEITACREQAHEEGRGKTMRPRTSSVLFVVLLFLIGVGTSAFANVLPAGTPLHIRTTQAISSEAGRDTLVRGVVDRSVRIRGQMIIPSGSPATLEVVDRSSRGQRVNLAVHSIRVNGVRYTVSSNEVQLGGSTGSRRWRRGTVGAIGGAAVGGLIGGGAGAAVGGTAGAATGVATAGTGRTQMYLPANSRLQFQVNRATHIGR